MRPRQKHYIVKRDGRREEVYFDKITSRIKKLCSNLNMQYIQPAIMTSKVMQSIYPGITTVELDVLAADTAASMLPIHTDYGILATRIAISNLHKETKKNFSDVIELLYKNINKRTGLRYPLISEYHYKIIMNNAETLNGAVLFDRDYDLNYFGFKLLEKLYLMKVNEKVVERPQHLLMRVAIGIHGEDVPAALETYNLLSEQYFIHGSPTLFNACTPRPHMNSGFQLNMRDDLKKIFKALSDCALISEQFGGVSVHVQGIRANGSRIRKTNGTSNGILPMLRVFNNSSLFIDQGYKRSASYTIYLEPWHFDILDFLMLKRNTGKEEYRARDLTYALWIPDIFMRRVEGNELWSLMCPDHCRELPDVHNDEFEKLYTEYEKAKKFVIQISARDLWELIIATQIETCGPLMLYKDSCNQKSNQKNLGTIQGASASAEAIQYTSPDEIAACNMASIALKKFVENGTFNFDKLKEVTKIVTKNLNKLIDVTTYAVPEAKTSSHKHRAIGLGVQGLADTFILMHLPYDSEEAKNLNIQIFETIYYSALETSCELASISSPYESYEGSPISKGLLQFDLWNIKPTELHDWDALKEKIAQHGIRNSLLISLMPTSNTSQILNNKESVDPYTSHICTYTLDSGKVRVVNPLLVNDLKKRDLWNDILKRQISAHNGSVQKIDSIPDDLKAIYKTAWELSQKTVIDMAADRGAYIDHSQSLNIHLEKVNYGIITSMHFYGWRKGLKTGCFNLRTKANARKNDISGMTLNLLERRNMVNRNLVPEDFQNGKDDNAQAIACSLQNPGTCESCGA